MGGGGASEVLTLQKRQAEKLLAILKGGHKCFGVVLTQVLGILTILIGGHKRFPPFEKGGGHETFYLA